MIIMDIKANNLYSFRNFHINMSHNDDINDSLIEDEFLPGKINFKYKKLNIILGCNATGKTSIGKLLMIFANYLQDGMHQRFFKIIDNPDETSHLYIDFVTENNFLNRFKMDISPKKDESTKEDVNISIQQIPIYEDDSYENCLQRMKEARPASYDMIDSGGWHFSYPSDDLNNKDFYELKDDEKYLDVLKCVLSVLDPSIKDIIKSKELENTYIIQLNNKSIIIQDGEIIDKGILSSGTKAGLNISYIIASIINNNHDLYYCDELFSFVNTDIEKACLSIIIEKLTAGKQLFFTTHNPEIIDMPLPLHSFTFLKKEVNDVNQPIKCIYASDYADSNMSSLKNAVENDLFCTAPDLDKLYDLDNTADI